MKLVARMTSCTSRKAGASGWPLPFSRLASRVFAAAPQAGGGRREQSALGGLVGGGVLGGILGGDDE